MDAASEARRVNLCTIIIIIIFDVVAAVAVTADRLERGATADHIVVAVVTILVVVIVVVVSKLDGARADVVLR